MLSVQCPKCGATNIFDETKGIPTYCSFCRGHLPDLTEYVKISLEAEADKKKLKNEERRHEMYMERARKEDRSDHFFWIVLVIVVVICAVVFISPIVAISKIKLF